MALLRFHRPSFVLGEGGRGRGGGRGAGGAPGAGGAGGGGLGFRA